MTFVSHAQNFEDVMLWRALKTIDRGFYIDVGANHPHADSVTKSFYDRGWRGINIEPLGALWHQLEAERPDDVNLRLIVSNARSTTTFYEVENSGLSTTEPEIAEKHRQAGLAIKEISVAANTLAEICAIHVRNEVHFLKIDVEGGTRSVLEGADFQRVRPWIILIEAMQPLSQTEDHADWDPLVTENGYDFVYADGLNRFYLAQERAYLKGHFRYPPNVFDEFVPRLSQAAPVAEPAEQGRGIETIGITPRLFRLVSFHDTVLYLDEASQTLRHGPQSQVPNNLILETVGERARLYVLGTRFGEVCTIETFVARQTAQLGQGPGHLCLGTKRLDDAMISITFDGKFLSCTPDGMAPFDRDRCQDWEMFRILPLPAGAFFLPSGEDGRPAAGATDLLNTGFPPPIAAQATFLISGPFNSSWSLAAFNRRLALELEQAFPGAVQIMPDDPTVEEHDSPVAGLVERAASREPPGDVEIVIHQRWPVEVPSRRGDVTLAYFFWEENRVPPDVVACLNAFDGVLTSAESVTYALRNSGLTKPVITAGYSPDLEPFERLYADQETRERGNRPFTFLHISRGYPRKGVDALLRAYGAAFQAGDDVCLVIKGPESVIASQREIVRAESAELAPVLIVDADLDLNGMLALYRAADVMVLPTRGEGFNVPAAEAIAAGLNLIVTGYGGHMQFCRGGIARLVDYTLVRSNSFDTAPQSLWAEPDAEDLRRALREAYAGALGVDDQLRKEALAALDAKSWIRTMVRGIADQPFFATSQRGP